MIRQITVCGGGNAAHTLAGLLGSRPGLKVHVFAPFGHEAEQWQAGIREAGGIQVQMPHADLLGQPHLVSSNPGLAVEGADLVILALPAFAHAAILEAIAPHLSPGVWVGALPARGGFDLEAREALGTLAEQVTLFGFQTLPWACRIQQYGQSVHVLGVKDQVDLAVWPPDLAGLVAGELEGLLGVRLTPISGFLSLTLADTGQIIHPGIVYGLFRDWDGLPFSQPKLFYQGVDEAIAAVLDRMSAEVQALRAVLEERFPGLDLSAVRPLHDWLLRSYSHAIQDTRSLQSCFASNRSYAGLTAPMHPVSGGFVPDFQARYLSEDVPYGLLVTRGIAELAGVAMPAVDEVLSWAQDRLGKEYLRDGNLAGADLSETRTPQRFGITQLEALLTASVVPDSTPNEPVTKSFGGKA